MGMVFSHSVATATIQSPIYVCMLSYGSQDWSSQILFRIYDTYVLLDALHLAVHSYLRSL